MAAHQKPGAGAGDSTRGRRFNQDRRRIEPEAGAKKAMTIFQNILFDLDGTLTDSGPGITRSVQYALGKLGIDEPDLVRLRTFVGPPLSDSFVRQYHLTTAETAKAVAYFRERYTVTGVYENALYPGITQMLKDLKAAGRHLAVASSKPEPLVLTVLEHFQIMPYFDVVCGADPAREEDGVARGSDKDIIVRRALSLLGEEDCTAACGEETAMVGDRCYDIDGAHANHVAAVGVSYGYGSREELVQAGADFVADSAEDLRRFLMDGHGVRR